MNLERISKDSENYNEVMNQRKKIFGNTGGYWYCDKCNHRMTSFLYNFEYHIPEDCPECKVGKMVEDVKQREAPVTFNMIDRSREKNWDKGLSPAQQASVLLGESDPY